MRTLLVEANVSRSPAGGGLGPIGAVRGAGAISGGVGRADGCCRAVVFGIVPGVVLGVLTDSGLDGATGPVAGGACRLLADWACGLSLIAYTIVTPVIATITTRSAVDQGLRIGNLVRGKSGDVSVGRLFRRVWGSDGRGGGVMARPGRSGARSLHNEAVHAAGDRLGHFATAGRP